MKKIILLVAVVLIAVVGFFVWQNSHQQPECFAGGTQCSPISGWKTFTDQQAGITFQYPETLPTTYITAQEWPPMVKLVSGVSACAVEPFIVNGRSYCVNAQTDGAAGSVYTTYTYAVAIPRIGKTIQMSFTLRSVQCANYDDPQKSACDSERASFNVDSLVDKMISTVQETSIQPADSSAAQFGFPIDQAMARITKKPFGIYITPATSPVQPEKFTGYHTGTDFETFTSEANSTVTIKAITSGKIIYKQWASGYGGVLVQSAQVANQPVTILYGHLALSSIALKVGDSLGLGETIGDLGQGYSHDTDGERKHLHLGVHQGSQVVLLGYVPVASDLSQWIDVTTLWQ